MVIMLILQRTRYGQGFIETFGEDPKLVSDINYTLIKGFQGEELDENSVSLTTKHFPGGGARKHGERSAF